MSNKLKIAPILIIIICVLIQLFVSTAYCEEIASIEKTNDRTELEGEALLEDSNNISEEAQESYEDDAFIPYSRAKVLRAIKKTENTINYSGGSLASEIQFIDALITNGPHKGEKIQVEYELTYGFSNKFKATPLKKGDEVFLFIEESEDGTIEKAYVTEVARDKYMLYLVIVFIVLLIVIGRIKGLKAVISLALTLIAVIKILLPAILKGWDPVLISILLCIAIISITLLIISGFNKKTLSAALGTTGGVIFAGLVALIIGSLAKLTGFGDDESQMLLYVTQDIQLNFRGLLFAGILIGTMGATMDVGMAISSAMHEIKINSPKIKTKELIRAGMNVGKDTMATMANTLILAYTGGSLHLMLLLLANKTPFVDIINWDIIASEILRAIAGSIGIIITVPLTALVTGFIEESNHLHKTSF